jgi:hypothetical protein
MKQLLRNARFLNSEVVLITYQQLSFVSLPHLALLPSHNPSFNFPISYFSIIHMILQLDFSFSFSGSSPLAYSATPPSYFSLFLLSPINLFLFLLYFIHNLFILLHFLFSASFIFPSPLLPLSSSVFIFLSHLLRLSSLFYFSYSPPPSALTAVRNTMFRV